METHLLIPATTPSAPPTPALLPTPPLLPTPAHKLTCHYFQPPSPPPLMQLNIPIPSRIHTPSNSITMPLSSSIAPSPIFHHTLQGLQRLGLPCHPNNNQRWLPSPGIFKDTPHPRNGQRCTLHTHTIFCSK